MKLSKAQWDLLENISWYPKGRTFRNLHVSYAPMRRLIRKGAVKRGRSRKDGWICFSITAEGVRALTNAPTPAPRVDP